MTTITDDFTGSGNLNGSAVGASSSVWDVLSGTWTRSGGLAVAAEAASANPIAVVDTGVSDVDLQVDGNSGDAIYFRVVDANNWWRYRFQYYETNFGVDVMPNYRWMLEKCVTGSVSHVYSDSAVVAFTESAFGTLRASAVGNQIKVYRPNGTTVATTITDAAFQTATRHGIGKGGSPDAAYSRIDNFSLLFLIGLLWSWWDGTTEHPATPSWWDGTAEVPVVASWWDGTTEQI